MMYADYNYYVANYFGSAISESDFPRLSSRASDYIDMITFGKAAAYVTDFPQDESVKKCCCALAENYLIIEKAKAASLTGNGELASESVGSHSVSYRSGADTASAAESEMKSICMRYLALTGLMYRGGVNFVYSTHCHTL